MPAIMSSGIDDHSRMILSNQRSTTAPTIHAVICWSRPSRANPISSEWAAIAYEEKVAIKEVERRTSSKNQELQIG